MKSKINNCLISVISFREIIRLYHIHIVQRFFLSDVQKDEHFNIS